MARFDTGQIRIKRWTSPQSWVGQEVKEVKPIWAGWVGKKRTVKKGVWLAFLAEKLNLW
jgi:hypothetical protein